MSQHRVVCEAFARLGELKPGQKRKLSSDLLKLLLVERALGGAWRRIIVVSGEEAVAWLAGGSWQARVVREFGIEISHVPLDHGLAVEILQSQVEQVMVNVSRSDV